jgi:hypothetical protein
VRRVPKPLLSQADWYASLPAVYVSAAMVITDPADRVLIVKPQLPSVLGRSRRHRGGR